MLAGQKGCRDVRRKKSERSSGYAGGDKRLPRRKAKETGMEQKLYRRDGLPRKETFHNGRQRRLLWKKSSLAKIFLFPGLYFKGV